MAKNIDDRRKYYSLRGVLLGDGDFYSSIKNQTFSQNDYVIYTAPTCLFSLAKDTDLVEFNSKFMIDSPATGKIILTAVGEDGRIIKIGDSFAMWPNTYLNGTYLPLAGQKTNPVELDSDTHIILGGYNEIEGSFDNDSTAERISITAVWIPRWEE